MDDTPETLTCRHELLIDRYFLASFIPSIPIATSLKEVTETSYLPVTTIVIWFMCILCIYIYTWHMKHHTSFLLSKKNIFLVEKSWGKILPHLLRPKCSCFQPTRSKPNQPAKSEINLLHFAPVFWTGKKYPKRKRQLRLRSCYKSKRNFWLLLRCPFSASYVSLPECTNLLIILKNSHPHQKSWK